jgi:hypothetical protein
MTKLTYKPAILTALGFVCFVIGWIYWPIYWPILVRHLRSSPPAAANRDSEHGQFRAAVGDVKAIRVSPDVKARGKHELVLFEQKKDLYQMCLIFKESSGPNDVEAANKLALLLISTETFDVTEDIKVRIIAIDKSAGVPFYQVKVLQGPQKNKLWLGAGYRSEVNERCLPRFEVSNTEIGLLMALVSTALSSLVEFT